jgi:GNAT superfamily N-acetyltransferase
MDDAEEASHVLRRSITELCHADHRGDAQTLGLWLANKTADNMRRWIDRHHVFVASKGAEILGVAAINVSGEILTLHVAPEARFRGVSKALLTRLEAQAAELAIETIMLDSTVTARQLYLSLGYEENGPPTKGFGKTFRYPMVKPLR